MTQDTEDVVARLGRETSERLQYVAQTVRCLVNPDGPDAIKLIQSLSDRIDVLEGALRRVEPYVDAIVCYASSMDEHEPNRIAVDVRAALHQEGIAPK